MKRILIPFLIIMISCSQRDQKPNLTGKEGQLIPDFQFRRTDSITQFKIQSTANEVPLVLFYFSPKCPFCRLEMRRIINDIDEFGKTQFVIVTSKDFKALKSFENEFKGNKYDNIKMVFDEKHQIANYYEPKTVPYLAIYGKDKRLINTFSGAIKMKQLKAVINS